MLTDFHFTVDEDYARVHNEFFRDAKRLQLSAAILGILLFIGVGVVWALQGGITVTMLMAAIPMGFFGLLCFMIIPALPKQMGSPQQYYDMYKLAPAIVAQVNARDIVLMALVDASAESNRAGAGHAKRPIPALAIRTVTSLPGVAREVGARVPSMAVTGVRTSRSQYVFEEISPMPVAWGTKDPAVWKEAEQAIPAEQWKKLDTLRSRLTEVQATKRDLLLLDQPKV